MFKVAAAYLITAWLLMQMGDTLAPALHLPDWVNSALAFFIILGFPLALIFAWAFEMTPEGLKKEKDVNSSESTPQASNQRLNHAIILLLALAVVYFVFEKLAINPHDDDGTLQTATVNADAAAEPVKLVADRKSIAVLPFVDMSQEGDQVFFGDGIAEEVLNELTGLEGLRVASRTSSFAYRDGDEDTRAIAKALNVATVLEGSVRKSGEQIKVTAQLINAADGYHLWSEVFERQLTDIFAIQEEIAGAVAGALGVRLGVGDINAFGGAGTTSVEAYEAYLRGWHTPLFPAVSSDERIRLLERAVELDPNYAAAWAALGLTIGSTMWISSVDDAPAIRNRAFPVLQRAIELGPDSAFAYTKIATVNYSGFDWVESEKYYLRAMEILPDGHTLGNYANMLMRSGRSSDSLRYRNRAQTAERNPAGPTDMTAWVYAATGQLEELRQMGNVTAGPGGFPFPLITALNTGDRKALHKQLLSLPAKTVVASVLQDLILNDFDSPDRVLATLRSVYSNRDIDWPSKYHDIALLAAFFGDDELALESISYEARLTTVRYGALWFPVMSEVRKLPGFKQLVSDVNLAEYWRTYGWTDHCRPIGADDFECF